MNTYYPYTTTATDYTELVSRALRNIASQAHGNKCLRDVFTIHEPPTGSRLADAVVYHNGAEWEIAIDGNGTPSFYVLDPRYRSDHWESDDYQHEAIQDWLCAHEGDTTP